MKLKPILLILLIIGLLALIKVFFLSPKKEEKEKGSPKAKPPAGVKGFIARAEPMQDLLFATGTLLPGERVELRPEVPGKLLRILFNEGQTVSRGALLAKVNDSELQAQLKRLQIQLKLAEEKASRLKALLDIQGVSLQEYDETARQVELIRADMAYTRAQIDKTEVRAPFSGLIGLRQVSPGSYVSSATVLATLQQTDRLKLDFTVPEKNSGMIRKGDQVQFTLDGSTEKHAATVYAIEPGIDVQTRNVTVRALCDKMSGGLLPGAFARVELKPREQRESIMIPTEAVIPELKGKKVFVGRGGKATGVKIETGVRTDARIEVSSGLEEGDTVIVTGIMSLKPDDAVRFTEIIR